VFAFGMSLLYPAMMMLALAGLPPSERGSAVGTVSSFFDLSQGLGAAVLGGVADATSYQGGFLAAAGLTLGGLAVLRIGTARRTASTSPSSDGVATAP
jgi:MFS family permease